ncbi:MAG: alpha-2-macroglobulin, partial [Sphingobacteriales bacterium]
PLSTWSDNGWYLIEATGSDKNGMKITERKYVKVWSPNGKGKTPEPLVVLPQSQQAEPGGTVTVHTVSGYTDLHLIRQIIEAGGKPVVSNVSYDGIPIVWTRKVSESDRGGLVVNYVTVKENRVYTGQSFINVPWTNKDMSISWETHRDKLLPGAKETWTMVVKGNKKEAIAAEMVATLYDASLDMFRPHAWNVYGLFPTLNTYINWNTETGFGQRHGEQRNFYKPEETGYYEKFYDQLYLMPGHRRYGRDMMSRMGGKGAVSSAAMNESVQMADMPAPPFPPKVSALAKVEEGRSESTIAQASDKMPAAPPVPTFRTNLKETAFFYPQLKTDAEGNVRIEFTMPEALTEWKFMAFAHTKDMSTGQLQGSVRTQKDLMVMPNLPRFMRQGDKMILSTKISNLSDGDLNGSAKLELVHAVTGLPMNLPFKLVEHTKSFTVSKGQSTTASWSIDVPASMYEPVTVRIQATAGAFTDGEESAVPVVTNRMLVTETLPLWINGTGTKEFAFDKLLGSNSSGTLAHHALTLEYSANPAWYAVKALPSLMEYQNECAEQIFNRFYATALAAHIVEQSPRIKAIFDKWKADTDALNSPLSNNQELKSALLQETPWVLEAQTEAEQRKRIGELFDTYKLSQEHEAASEKLRELQLPDGSFPWFKGMQADHFTTQYIVTGFGRLRQLGIVAATSGPAKDIAEKGLRFLDRNMKRHYDNIIRSKAKTTDQHISYADIQYLYMRSFFKQQPVSTEQKPAYTFYQTQAATYWSKLNPYLKGMIAIALNRAGNKAVPTVIIKSLKETAIRNEEMGMYWMQPGEGYWWYQAPVEAQALLIEAFREVNPEVATIDAMKTWLLKNKQTQNWKTSRATADACYALLLTGTNWLSRDPQVTVQLGNTSVSNTSQASEAGTGYFKLRIPGQEVKPDMGNISLNVTDKETNAASWGAVYWQYFEDLDKISKAATPLELRKQLFIERNTTRGPELQPISDGNSLKVGDKLVVRLEVIVDRDMDYVHLKDMRAAAFEPVNVISGYSWQGGLGYYQSTRDVSTNFFFDHLRKGKYVLEYPAFVSQSGNFSNGIATIQCMYAPEFASHSEGIRVNVTP